MIKPKMELLGLDPGIQKTPGAEWYHLQLNTGVVSLCVRYGGVELLVNTVSSSKEINITFIRSFRIQPFNQRWWK